MLTDATGIAGLGVPTRLAVRTDGGEVRVDVPSSGLVEVPLPDGPTDSVAVEVLDTDEGPPASVLTGLVTVDLDGVAVTESVVAPSDRPDPADAVLLSGGLPGSDACVHPEDDVVCFGDGGRDPEGGAPALAAVHRGRRWHLRRQRDGRRVALGSTSLPGLAIPGVGRPGEQQSHDGGRRPAGGARRR